MKRRFKIKAFLASILVILILSNVKLSHVHADSGILNVSSLGVNGNDRIDDTKNIQKALKIAFLKKKDLYFPSGIYLLSGDINLHDGIQGFSGVSILGEPNGFTVFDGRNAKQFLLLQQAEYHTKLDDVAIQDIVFRNMGVKFYGNYNTNIRIARNVFTEGLYSTSHDYISVHHRTFLVEDNILLRGKGYPGRGIVTYRTTNTTIKNNYIGNIEQRQLLKAYSPGLNQTMQKLIKLGQQGVININNQGNFITGINAINYDEGLTIQGNVVSGDKTQVTPEGIKRDHVMYLKGYAGVFVVGNYFSGWMNDATGGVKVRNGDRAYIGSNVFDDVGLLLYVYDDYADKSYLKLTNTTIYRNVYRGKTNHGKWGTGFSYTQDFVNTQERSSQVFNNVFYDNQFDSSTLDRIQVDTVKLLDGQKADSFLFYHNQYASGSQVKGVTNDAPLREILRRVVPQFYPYKNEPFLVK